MSISAPPLMRRSVLLLVVIAAALVLALPGAARAGVWEENLPGKTWQTNGEVFASLTNIWASVLSGPSAICVGPVQYNGGWKFPYGWNCAEGTVEWSFSSIEAAGAVDNPNSSADRYIASDW